MDRHEIEQVFHIQYRGFLDYCNFSCNYCPFSKKSYSLKKEKMDRNCLFKLFLKLKKETQPITLQIVPYGEALIYSYYWEFLAKVSQLPQVLAIGCQTNASFSVEKMIAVFLAQGGKLEKLRLWCSFHPTMISAEKFFFKIQELRQYSIKLCVGAVANPLEKQAIVQLFSMLPKDIYFWLNKMDGRKQPYTIEESDFFKTIDPFFFLEEAHFLADPKNCSSKNLFIEANGDYFACNISKISLGNIYNDKKMLHSYILENQWNKKKCACKECHCFLAYQNRFDLIPELFLFFPYPAFRIITYYQAAFVNYHHF